MSNHTARPIAPRQIAQSPAVRRVVLPLLVLALLGAVALISGNRATASSPVKRVTISMGKYLHSVQITIPKSWHVSKTSPTPDCGCGGPSVQVCIVAGGDYRHDPDRCELYIVEQKGWQSGDTPAPNWRLPACKSWSTIADGDSTAAGHAADYREFLDRCTGKRSEQWATVTDAQVTFWHPIVGAASNAAAAQAVRTARIVGKVQSGRMVDEGLVRSVSRVGSKSVRVTIDRVVPNLNGSLINYNPQTYSYVVRTNGPSDYSTCSDDISACTQTQMIKQFRKGTHPADRSKAVDGAEVIVYSNADHGSSSWSMFNASPYRFASSGDHGCGCR